MGYLETRFPAVFQRIEAQRKHCAELAEICHDLETLAGKLDQHANRLDPQIKQDILDSMNGLENEISALLEISNETK